MLQPPPGTARAETVGDRVSVCAPLDSVVTVVPFADAMGMTVVVLVYVLFGVEIGVNCANAVAIPKHERAVTR